MTVTYDLETKDYDELTNDELDAREAGMRSYTVPKDRKNKLLWQTYLHYAEATKTRQRCVNRIRAIESGKSNMSLEHEELELEKLSAWKDQKETMMIEQGETLGPIWDAVIKLKGLKNGALAAQLLSQIDDISKFSTISKLWRYCGKAVIDGKAERKQEGVVLAYNNKLKSICYLISRSFTLSQTSPYVDIYYAEKLRQYELHPNGICRVCQIPVRTKDTSNEKGNPTRKTGSCPNNKSHTIDFTATHIDLRARRKMEKEFLKDIWIAWREADGLPISDPYLDGKYRNNGV